MKLDEYQRAIVEAPITLKTALSITAGAGSGKTTTSCQRAHYMMTHHKIKPSKILLTTFSNRAARDMRHKLKEITGLKYKDMPTVTTTHSLCLDILREFKSEDILVLSEWDNIMIFRNILEELKSCSQLPKHITTGATNRILKELSKMYANYNLKLHMDKLNQYVYDNTEDYETVDQHLKLKITYQEMYEIINKANKYKDENNLVSFDDILYDAFELLMSDEKALESIRKKYIYVTVDESQDLNALQHMYIYNVFNTGHTSIVFDTMQELYSFRHSNTSYLKTENLYKAYNEVISLPLVTNFRSSHPIVKLGNILRGFGKSELIQEFAEHTKKYSNRVFLKRVKNQIAEANYIAKHIKSLIDEGIEYRDISVLSRTNRYISTVLEPIMIENQIPYIIQGSKTKKLSAKSEVLFIIHCLQLFVASPKAQVFIINQLLQNFKGIGPKTAKDLSRILDGGLFALMNDNSSKGKELREMLLFVQEESLSGLSVSRMSYYIEKFLSYSKFNLNDRYKSELKQLFSNWGEIYIEETGKTLEQILPDIQTSLDSVDEDTRDAVILTTIHSSKGLSYPHCIACGFTYRTPKQAKGTADELYAFYVQVSRAEKSLLIMHSDVIKYEGSEIKGYKMQWLTKLIQHLER